jgi:hypothetical protein
VVNRHARGKALRYFTVSVIITVFVVIKTSGYYGSAVVQILR